MTKQIMLQASLGVEHEAGGSSSEDFSHLREGETDWARLEAMTGEEALRNALADPDAQPLTPESGRDYGEYRIPKRIRTRMNLTQEAFARRFEIALGTLRDWEQGSHIPDSTAKAYLRVIEQNPEAVVAALEASRSRAGC